MAATREQSLSRRSTLSKEMWPSSAKQLPPLSVFIQNQTGNHPMHWDRRGTVVEVKGHDQYMVKVNWSRRITRRNRKYLRKFQPHMAKPFNMASNIPAQQVSLHIRLVIVKERLQESIKPLYDKVLRVARHYI